jgi:transcriptional regulator with XRE-family HTH domain
VDNRDEVREFLSSRRAKITPEQAGLPAGTGRRVTGLRRSEVAALADVSVEYYAELERGNLAGVSPAVLEAVARALQLDDAERAHLLHLAQAQAVSDTLARPRRRSGRQRTLHKSLQWTLDAVTAGPAFVVNGRLDVLAANQLARAFFSDLCGGGTQPPNLARYQFLDAAARRFYPDWDRAAGMTVDLLRTEAGSNPHDKDLHDLIGELSPAATPSAPAGEPTT